MDRYFYMTSPTPRGLVMHGPLAVEVDPLSACASGLPYVYKVHPLRVRQLGRAYDAANVVKVAQGYNSLPEFVEQEMRVLVARYAPEWINMAPAQIIEHVHDKTPQSAIAQLFRLRELGMGLSHILTSCAIVRSWFRGVSETTAIAETRLRCNEFLKKALTPVDQ